VKYCSAVKALLLFHRARLQGRNGRLREQKLKIKTNKNI
jgi:hypothetical protein